MSTGPLIAEIAALAGDPARANILCALLDGRAMTATELAYAARVTPQTASAHLGLCWCVALSFADDRASRETDCERIN